MIDLPAMTIRLKLSKAETDALQQVAGQELRYLPEQALYIVRQELTRRGLLPEPIPSPQPDAPKRAA